MAIVGLDGDHVAVGFGSGMPIQVWDLAASTKLREFDGEGANSSVMVGLLDARIAASGHNGNQQVITIFDVNTGESMQELTPDREPVSMAYDNKQLVVLANGDDDQSVQVWGQDSAGRVSSHGATRDQSTEHCHAMVSTNPQLSVILRRHALPVSPQFTKRSGGRAFRASPAMPAVVLLAPLSRMPVIAVLVNPAPADNGSTEARIDLWVVEQGRVMRSLRGFGCASLRGFGLLPNFALFAVDMSGCITTVPLMRSDQRVTIKTDLKLVGVLPGPDESFVTLDTAGNIKVWRNGACDVTIPGTARSDTYGVAMAVVGRRLVVVGESNNLLVSE